MLDFRKSEAGKLKAELKPSDGIKIITDSVNTFLVNAKQRRIEIGIEANEERLWGMFDKEKMEQIIYNLISNAFKYTHNGGAINVWVEVSENMLHISIADNGIGIDNDKLDRIFEPFNNLGTTPYDGNTSGMGLALTRNLIKILNGKIIYLK